MTGLQMAFTAVLRFGTCSALLAMGAKMPPGGHRRPHRRRNVRGEYRDIAAHAGRPGGHKKPAPGKPRAGGGGILTDVAISADVCAVLDAGINDCFALLQCIGVYGDMVAALTVWAGGVVDVGPPQIVSVDDVSLVFRAFHCVPSFLPRAGLPVVLIVSRPRGAVKIFSPSPR